MPENLSHEIRTTCCIAGGGPAGMMLGLLLARAGVDVVVLEKHADFLRDFRGDTIHPSTLEVMHELGLLEEFLARPHQKVQRLTGIVGCHETIFADFSWLRVQCPYIAFMPQWDFLDFLATQGKKYPGFKLKMQAEATGLLEENGRITGVEAKTPGGAIRIHASLVVAADGRHSVLREKANLPVTELGAPIDALWMKISRKSTDPAQPVAKIDRGRVFVMLYREDYWQCAYVISKNGYEEIRRKGLESFRNSIADLAPFLGNRPDEIASWDDVKLLTVRVDCLKEWSKPGLLCIGDAAHAMSPIGGVGINLAVQDAIAASNILAGALKTDRLTAEDLKKVQRRRMWPTRMTQRVQIFMQNRLFGPIVSGTEGAPPVFMWLVRIPFLRYIPGYLVGIGFRPEHIKPDDKDAA